MKSFQQIYFFSPTGFIERGEVTCNSCVSHAVSSVTVSPFKPVQESNTLQYIWPVLQWSVSEVRVFWNWNSTRFFGASFRKTTVYWITRIVGNLLV